MERQRGGVRLFNSYVDGVGLGEGNASTCCVAPAHRLVRGQLKRVLDGFAVLACRRISGSVAHARPHCDQS